MSDGLETTSIQLGYTRRHTGHNRKHGLPETRSTANLGYRRDLCICVTGKEIVTPHPTHSTHTDCAAHETERPSRVWSVSAYVRV